LGSRQFWPDRPISIPLSLGGSIPMQMKDLEIIFLAPSTMAAGLAFLELTA
jgi:hypothetical protein